MNRDKRKEPTSSKGHPVEESSLPWLLQRPLCKKCVTSFWVHFGKTQTSVNRHIKSKDPLPNGHTNRSNMWWKPSLNSPRIPSLAPTKTHSMVKIEEPVGHGHGSRNDKMRGLSSTPIRMTILSMPRGPLTLRLADQRLAPSGDTSLKLRWEPSSGNPSMAPKAIVPTSFDTGPFHLWLKWCVDAFLANPTLGNNGKFANIRIFADWGLNYFED